MFYSFVQWLTVHADGDWEHENGIEISTEDDSSWVVKIGIGNTVFDGVTFAQDELNRFPHLKPDLGEYNFICRCDTEYLGDVITLFFDILVPKAVRESSLLYDLWVPITGEFKYWVKVFATLTPDLQLIIKEIPDEGEIEIIAEDYHDSSRKEVEEIRSLGFTIPYKLNDKVDVKLKHFKYESKKLPVAVSLSKS